MKTIFKNFKIRNAECIEYADIPLENQGIVLIKGDNLDEGGSNGAGKTSLFELFCYTCLCETSKEMKANELLNLYDPHNLHLELDFQKNNNIYNVAHFRNHSIEKTKIRVKVNNTNTTPKGIKNNTKIIKDFIIEQIGFSPREFYGWIYLCQKFNHIMVNGKPTEKKNYMSSYFGLNNLDTLISTTKTRLNSIQLPNENSLLELQTSIAEKFSTYDIKKLEKNINENEKIQKELQQKQLHTQLAINKQEDASKVQEQRENFERQLKIYNLTFDHDLEKLIDSHSNQIIEYTNQINNLIKRQQLEEQLSNLGVSTQHSYEEIKKELDDTNELLQKTEKIKQEVIQRNNLEKQLKNIPKWKITQQEITKQIKQLEELLKEPKENLIIFQAEINKLNKVQGVCQSCLQPVSKKYQTEAIKDRTNKISKLEQQINKLTEQLKQYKEIQEQIEHSTILLSSLENLSTGNLENIQTILKDSKNKKEELDKLIKQIVQITSITGQLKQIPTVTSTLSDLQENKIRAEQELRVIKQAYSWFLQYGSTVFDFNELGRLQIIYKNVTTEYQKITTDIAQWKEQIITYEQLQKQLKDVNNLLATSSEEKNKSRVLEVVHIVLNDIRKIKLRESTELLTQVLPSNIKQLFPKGDVGIEITDKSGELDLFLKKRNVLIPMKNLSGGQGKRVGIAIVCAFAKMGSKLTNLLITDEPFKDLDPYGRKAAYELFKDLNIGTLLLTSHDEDVGVDGKYDQTWVIQMQNGKSKLYL